MSDGYDGRLERGRHPDVEPLEVWQLELDGAPVRRLLGVPDADAMRARGAEERFVGEHLGARAGRFVHRLRSGGYDPSLFPDSQQSAARAVRGCRHVCFAGGLSRLEGFERAAREHCDSTWMLADGEAGAALRGAGEVVADEIDGSEPIFAVDVGQTAVKSALIRVEQGGAPALEHLRRTERPLDRLPIGVPNPEAAPGERPQESCAEDSIAFIADTIDGALGDLSVRPECVVLALPCKLEDDLTPGVSTYEGWDRTPDLVERMVRRSGLDEPGRRIWAVNDAELAGCAVRADAAGRDRTGDVLVLTLGFGPGGAYVAEVDDDT